MCSSPTASFVTAAVTGTAGLFALWRTRNWREWPIAAMPLIFAVQQCIEGALWLTLPDAADQPLAVGLVGMFLFFAQVFWPTYAPLAVLLIEPHKGRRRTMLACLAVGAMTSAYLLWGLVSHDHSAAIVDDHIVYGTEVKFSVILGLAYLVGACVPALLSTHRAVLAVGVVVMVGATVTFFAYWEWFASVWCFFAAAASALVLLYFERTPPKRPAASG
jgi:hypothetical protein